jgi:hypothetical protein
MRKKTTSIPVNPMADEFSAGIAIGKVSVKDLHTFEEAELRTYEQQPTFDSFTDPDSVPDFGLAVIPITLKNYF